MLKVKELVVTFKSGRQRRLIGDIHILCDCRKKAYEIEEKESSTRWDVFYKQIELLEVSGIQPDVF